MTPSFNTIRVPLPMQVGNEPPRRIEDGRYLIGNTLLISEEQYISNSWVLSGLALPLPKAICVLDVETAATDLKRPEESELAVVGVKEFNLRDNRYWSTKYTPYFPETLSNLEQFLYGFSGLIIGFNIFKFDYRVLRPYINLERVVEKTFDLLLYLSWKRDGRYKNLSLNKLCTVNLGLQKSKKGSSIPKLWAEGKREEVICSAPRESSGDLQSPWG